MVEIVPVMFLLVVRRAGVLSPQLRSVDPDVFGPEESLGEGDEQVTIATDSGGRQRTSPDGASQVRYAAALAVRTATWLRDEEADLDEAVKVTIFIDPRLGWQKHNPDKWYGRRNDPMIRSRKPRESKSGSRLLRLWPGRKSRHFRRHCHAIPEVTREPDTIWRTPGSTTCRGRPASAWLILQAAHCQ